MITKVVSASTNIYLVEPEARLVVGENEQKILIHHEDKWRGPDGVVIDITDTGWTGARPLDAD